MRRVHFMIGSLLIAITIGMVPTATAQDSAPKPVSTMKLPGLKGAHFSPGNEAIITWALSVDDQPGQVIVWNPTATKKLRTLEGHDGEPRCGTFSANGGLFAAGGDTGVWVWDTRTGRMIARFQNKYAVFGVALSPDGSVLAAGSEKKVWVRDVKAERLIATRECGDSIHRLIFSPDGRTLVAGCIDGTIWVWGDGGKGEGKKLSAHTKWVYGLAFSPDGKMLASGSDDMTVIVWNSAEWKPIKVIDLGKFRVLSVAFSRDGKTLAVGGASDIVVPPDVPLEKQPPTGKVLFYSAKDFLKVGEVTAHALPVYSVSFNGDGNSLATSGYEKPFAIYATLKLWKVSDFLPRLSDR